MARSQPRKVERAVTARRLRRPGIRPWVYALAIPSVFVVAVIMMALQEGASDAVMTAFVAFATTGTAIGLWGTAMAVRDTHDFSPRPELEHPEVVPVHNSRAPR